MPKPYSGIIIFDSDCPFCSRMVQFVHKHKRPERKFYFSGIHSQFSSEIFTEKGINAIEDTVYYYRAGHLYKKTKAVRYILMDMGNWPMLLAFAIDSFPLQFADKCYDAIARRRMKISNKRKHCKLNPSLDPYILL
jgi:predicted DCC family thiol-disulfide oxidoreductase YuxK